MATMANMWIRSAQRLSNITQIHATRQVSRSAHRSRFWSTTATDTNSQTDDAPKTSENAESNDATKSEIAQIELKWKEEKSKLEEDLKSFKDKYVRSLAETENVRQRMIKQIDDAKAFGIQGFCKDLLEVADVLNMAVDNVPKDEVPKNVHLKNLFDGLTMTESQLQKAFNKHGLVKIEPKVGDKFDPYVHEAMYQVPTENKESNSNVAAVNKIGYKLKERTIRPAIVGVFKA
ncbi:grpE protein homolog 1, mitochondrial-like [Mytilus trossulus]|uniref:grpE protein homolog 1, mitochondrial-like n=1 Tax=Mytilus trossulus TaxID=6551 RepID=UPI00300758F5